MDAHSGESHAGGDGGFAKVTSIVLASILQDCVSQLGVIGAIIPVGKESAQTQIETIKGEEIGEAVEETRLLESEYDRLITERQLLHHEHASEDALQDNEDAVRRIAKQLKQSTKVLVKNLKANPVQIENTMKVQRERQHVQDVLHACREELLEYGRCDGLVDAVTEEVQAQADIIEAVDAANQSKQTAAELLVELESTSQLAENEIRELDEEIAQLKDQLQETKARVALESNYIKQDSAVRVTVAKKTKTLELSSIEEELNEVRSLEAEEQKCSEEILGFLKENYNHLKQKQMDWMNKYEQDVAKKQLELDELKRSRATGLKELQDLTEMYKDYEQVCKDDRQAREDARIAAQLAVKKLAAAIRIQAWWRGMVARGKVGGKGKKGKGKKGKGKKSGKKKKKK